MNSVKKKGFIQNLPLLLVIAFPALELWGIIEMGRWLGGWSVLGLLLLGVCLGYWLVRIEGRRVWQEVKRKIREGEPPGFALFDGLCVWVGGILLIIPGFISDVIGLTMLFPLTRPLYRMFLYRWLERLLKRGSIGIHRG
ncbi:MAG: FxsA family protein [Candidatus Cohnella colombiensis]|uniref:FxsA family protein n=1 Tax=Candidatus Cohnella colombiensis TaxID=3121368 RepID=A0AA95F1Y4_9BACL|nr:MAG: FxsA family protein [Cohnella sp.]